MRDFTGDDEAPNDATWIRSFIEGGDAPLDLAPVKRRIQQRKREAIEAESLASERTAMRIMTQTAPFISLPPQRRSPWLEEDS